METLSNSLSKTFVFKKGNFNMNKSDVFADKFGKDYNEYNIFLAYFNTIPNLIQEIKINCKRANNWLIENYKNEITDLYFNKRYFKNNKTAEFDDVFYFLYDDLIVYFDSNHSRATFLFRKTDISKFESIICGIKKFKKKKANKPQVLLLVSSRDGFETKSLDITRPKLCLEDNYNDDFKEVHHIIMKGYDLNLIYCDFLQICIYHRFS